MTKTQEMIKAQWDGRKYRQFLSRLEQWVRKNVKVHTLKPAAEPLPPLDITIETSLLGEDTIDQVITENLTVLLALLPEGLAVVHRETASKLIAPLDASSLMRLDGKEIFSHLEQQAAAYIESVSLQAAHDRERKARLTPPANQ